MGGSPDVSLSWQSHLLGLARLQAHQATSRNSPNTLGRRGTQNNVCVRSRRHVPNEPDEPVKLLHPELLENIALLVAVNLTGLLYSRQVEVGGGRALGSQLFNFSASGSPAVHGRIGVCSISTAELDSQAATRTEGHKPCRDPATALVSPDALARM